MSNTRRKVLMLSTDQNLLKSDSHVSQRLLKTAELVDELHVVVLTSPGFQATQLAQNIFYYLQTQRLNRFIISMH